MEASPTISSFVVRIIQDPAGETTTPYRGSILHVQSNQELTFTDISEAVEFINEFVPIHSLAQEKTPDQE